MGLRSRGEKAFAIFNYIFMTLIAFITIYPMWHVLMTSFSDPTQVFMHRGAYFWIRGTPQIRGYQLVFENPNILSGFQNTLIYVAAGSGVGMIMTILASYGLSRKGTYWNSKIMKFMVFTMFFHGGLIPFFIQMRNMGFLDTRWAVILPSFVSVMNIIIMRTSFVAIPDSLVESAKLDGASELRIVTSIVIPVSKATIAVIALFYTVGHWNAWFNAAIFLNDRSLWPIQLILREVLLQGDTSAMVDIGAVGQAGIERYRLLVRYSTIVVSTVPILMIYPFLQKYFVSGVMIGSLKE